MGKNSNYRSMDKLYQALIDSRDNDTPVEFNSREAGKLYGEFMSLRHITLMALQKMVEVLIEREGKTWKRYTKDLPER